MVRHIGTKMLIGVAITVVSTAAGRADEEKTLVIDSIVHHLTPQSGPWCMFAEFRVGDSRVVFKNQDNDGDAAEIELDLIIPEVTDEDQCNFNVYIDDDADEVETNADDRARGNFQALPKGKRTFRYTTRRADNYYMPAARDSKNIRWHFTVYWHLE